MRNPQLSADLARAISICIKIGNLLLSLCKTLQPGSSAIKNIIDVAYVYFDGAICDLQLLGDIQQTFSIGHKIKDFLLSWRQTVNVPVYCVGHVISFPY